GWKNAPTLTDAIYASLDTLHVSDEKITEQYVLDTIERMAQRSRERKEFFGGIVNKTAPLATAAIIGAIALQMTTGFRSAAYDNRVTSAVAAAEQAKTDYAAKQRALLEELNGQFAIKESSLNAQYEDKNKELAAKEADMLKQFANKTAALAKQETDFKEQLFGKLPTLTERVQSSFNEIETKYFLQQLIVAYNTNAAQVLESSNDTIYDQTSSQNVRIIRRQNMLFKEVDGNIVTAITYGQNNEMTAAMLIEGTNVTYVNSEHTRITTFDKKDRLVYRGQDGFDTYKTQLQKMTDEYRTLQSRGPNGFNATPDGAQKPAAQKPAPEQPIKSGVPLGKVIAGG
ncbi:TPA: hypothetical protein HA251_03685, partial [Candidatus Woesearchaeota archaeon]|nr:hypothetical protein [Candidatus Woesearchaeota archaeon]